MLLAQRAADEAVGEATAKARQMLDDAEIQARRVVADAEAEARRRGETERRRLEEEVLDLAGERDALLADVEALSRFEADYRERMVRALEADLTALRSRPPASPGTRPEPTDIELPVLSEGFARRDVDRSPRPTTRRRPRRRSRRPTPRSSRSRHPSAPATAAPFATPPAPKPAPRPRRHRSRRRPTHVRAPTVRRRPDRVARRRRRVGDAGGRRAELVRAQRRESPTAMAFDQAGRGDRDRRPTAAGGSARTAIDDDSIDAEVLDDDAFFATLREAVHDETPLGPRDEEATGENMFFDQEADNPGFRDVFRRRR